MDSPDQKGNMEGTKGPHCSQTLYAKSGGLTDIIPPVCISMACILCKEALLITMYVTTDHVCNIRQNTRGPKLYISLRDCG